MNVKSSAKLFAKFARQENKLSEKFSRLYPNYIAWGELLFNEKKSELITLLGRF